MSEWILCEMLHFRETRPLEMIHSGGEWNQMSEAVKNTLSKSYYSYNFL